MAVTYNLNVSRLGSSDSFSVGAIITDDTKPIGHQTESVAIFGKLDTPERKQQVINELKRQYEAEKQKVIDDAATIGTLGDEIKTAVETWESK